MDNYDADQNEKIDKMISEEILRFRISKILNEPSKSRLQQFTTNPLTVVIVGFLLTWGIGTLLTDKFKSTQLENQKSLEEIKSKRENGIIAVNNITELMYERYATLTLLASSLKRHSSLNELRERKKICDEAYLKWNNNLQVTQLAVRSLTSDTVYSRIEGIMQYGLTPHFAAIDNVLTIGYDTRLNHKQWIYPQPYLKGEFTNCLDCCYTISNYLWIKTNLYGDKKLNTEKALKMAEDELNSRCSCCSIVP